MDDTFIFILLNGNIRLRLHLKRRTTFWSPLHSSLDFCFHFCFQTTYCSVHEHVLSHILPLNSQRLHHCFFLFSNSVLSILQGLLDMYIFSLMGKSLILFVTYQWSTSSITRVCIFNADCVQTFQCSRIIVFFVVYFTIHQSRCIDSCFTHTLPF